VLDLEHPRHRPITPGARLRREGHTFVGTSARPALSILVCRRTRQQSRGTRAMLAQGISLAASAHLAVDHTRLGAAGRAGLPQGGTGTAGGESRWSPRLIPISRASRLIAGRSTPNRRGPCATSPDASAPRLESSDEQTDGPVTDSNLEPAGTLKAQKDPPTNFCSCRSPSAGTPGAPSTQVRRLNERPIHRLARVRSRWKHAPLCAATPQRRRSSRAFPACGRPTGELVS
jgi:hypothetical protein